MTLQVSHMSKDLPLRDTHTNSILPALYSIASTLAIILFKDNNAKILTVTL